MKYDPRLASGEKFITFFKIFTLRWTSEEDDSDPIVTTHWEDICSNFLLWLDLNCDWMWKYGILRYGNWFYRHTFGPEKCKDCFNHMKDYHELYRKVNDLEKKVEEIEDRKKDKWLREVNKDFLDNSKNGI